MDLIVTDLNGDGAMDQIYIEKEIGEDRFGGQAKVQLGVPVANSVLSDSPSSPWRWRTCRTTVWYDKDGNAIGDTGNGLTGIMSTTDYPTTTTVRFALSPDRRSCPSTRPAPFRDRTPSP